MRKIRKWGDLKALDRQSRREFLFLGLLVVALLVNALLARTSILNIADQGDRLERLHEFRISIEQFESTVIAAEGGQRGYLLTGDVDYLEPYQTAVGRVKSKFQNLEKQAVEHSLVLGDFPKVAVLLDQKFGEMDETIRARSYEGSDEAKEIVATDVGKVLMDEIRGEIDAMRDQADLISHRLDLESKRSSRAAVLLTLGSSIISLVVIGVIQFAVLHSRDKVAKLSADLDVKQAEVDATTQQLKLFLEQVSDYAIFVVGPDLQAKSWNQGVEKLLGHSEEEFIGGDITTLLAGQGHGNNEVFKEIFHIAREQGECTTDRWIYRKDGEQFWASGVTTAVFGDSGELLGYHKVLRDLTPRKIAEDQQKRLASELSESDRNKTVFLAMLAHELRNPLAPIKSAMELLAVSDLDEDKQETIAIANRQVDLLVRMVDDLLDISRISRGRLEVKSQPLNVVDAIDDAVVHWKPLLSEKSQSLVITGPKSPLFVSGDAARLTQVFSNLLSNASRYSPVGASISLTYGWEGDDIFIAVRDQGEGIAAEDQEQIFEMFSQSLRSIEQGSQGLGIGLSVVKSIVGLHGGSVSVESEGRGKGSIFTVRIPSTPTATSTNDLDGDLVNRVSTGDFPTRPLNVLVVDDSRSIVLIMKKLLKRFGHRVDSATDGEEALSRLLDEHSVFPDVVFSDISMPRMNGYELIETIRTTPKLDSLRVIAMTGFGQEDDRSRMMQAGFDEHVVKPIDISKLQEILFATTTRS